MSMHEKDIWDDVNQEWISWDEVLSYDMDESDYQYNFLFYEKYIQPQQNTTSVSNKSKQINFNTKNSQSKSRINATNMRKSYMALHYKSAKLNKHLESYIEGITPNQIPEDISSLFLEKIWDTMNKDIQKDVKELFEVYFIHQWTATSLMAGRLLENVLKIHIKDHLKEEAVTNIGNAIKKL